MIAAIIIDDELKGRKLLEVLIEKHCPMVNIIGQASSAKEGKELIEQLNPDLVFLDVEMPGGSGFDLLNQLNEVNFSLIFTTAFNQYAIKAIKFSAVDYLLKPIDEEELVKAVNKVVKKEKSRDITDEVKNMIQHYQKPQSLNNKIALSTMEGLEFVEIDKIIRCEADSKYTFVYVKDKKKLHVTKNLKEFEELLNEYNFFRIHHSHLVNLSYITKYHKGRGGYVVLEDGSTIGVSQRKKEDFLNHLKMI